MKLFALFSLLALAGCSSPAPVPTAKSLALLYANPMGQGKVMRYELFVAIEEYDTTHFDKLNFPALAKEFVFHHPEKKPVGIVTFLRPMSMNEFDVSEPDVAGLYKYRIISVQL